MVNHPRKGIVLGAAGLVAGVALGAMGMMSLRGGDGPYATSPPATRSMGAASAPASSYVTAVSVHCEMAPILPAGGEGDGQASLQAKPAGASAGEVGSLILAGKEAAAAGRPRDAEVSFLNACRNAALLQEGNGTPIADAMYQLGRHYATVAAFGSPKAKESLQRAERLYSASLEGYRTRLGATHEKTKFAQEGLITVQQGTGTAVAGNAAPAAAAPAPAAAPETPVAAAPAPAAPAPAAPAAPAPVAAAPAPAPAPQARTSAAPTPAKPSAAPAKAAAPAPAKAAEPPVQATAADTPAQPRRSAPAPAPAPKAAAPESRPQPEAARQPAAEPQPQPRPRRAPARTATATAEAEPDAAPPAPPRPVRVVPQEPEFDAPPPPPRSSAMGGNAGEVPTAEGSAGDQ